MKKKINWIVVILFFIFLISLLYFSIFLRRPVEIDSGYRVVMGTFARVVAIVPDSKTAKKSIEAAFSRQKRVEELMSYHKSDSELNLINRLAYKEPVKVSDYTFEVLQSAMEFSKLTDGAFDVTVGPLVDLWHLAARQGRVPTGAELTKARSKVGWQNMILNVNQKTVRFAVDGMKLDLGGIAKGYAIDKSIKALKDCGAVGGMVDIGGDIRCFGKPPKGNKNWFIGLQDPNEKFEIPVSTGKPLLVLKLTDEAIATSGGYRRFALIKGKKYSHIIDSDTGFGTDKLTSVTIIASDAVTADALATAVSVMGDEKGFALIEKLPKTEAILIPTSARGMEETEYEIITTSGAQKYIKQQ
jgi:thiamine biosynthesis lipoprotein